MRRYTLDSAIRVNGLFHAPADEDAFLPEVERFHDAEVVGKGINLSQGANVVSLKLN